MSEKQQPSEKRRRWTAKAKLEVVLEGLKGQESVAEICRRHGITQSMFYEWQEAMLKAGEEGLTRGDARPVKRNSRGSCDKLSEPSGA